MEEGTIVDYNVKVGDKVEKGDCIFELETDKATLEVESPADGFVKHILAEVGQTLQVGQAVLILADKDEDVPQEFVDSLKMPTATSAPQAPAAKPGSVPPPLATKSAPPAVPAVPDVQVKLGATIPLTRKQKITARKMLQSKREIPCFYLTVRADVTDVVELRTRMNKKADVKVSYHDFIMRAVATGIEKFPIMTGQLAGDAIRLADCIDIGLAVTVPDGLVAPILRNVNKKDVTRIASESKALIEKAVNNKLTPDDLEGGCITVSNLGPFAVDSFIPIVVPGQCSILGVGRITDTCVPGNDPDPRTENPSIMVRKLMNLTLSVDHRITNGTYAAQFLDFVRKLLEDASGFA
jgi:pyruvate dehydrogenase E2 component (dihydrolipoamide acetyltransferase)